MDRTAPKRHSLTRLLLICSLALAAIAAIPGSASAGAPCDGELFDSYGADWDYSSGGYIDDGNIGNYSRSDAYDYWTVFNISADGGQTWSQYSNPDSSGCSLEDNNREVVYPADTTTVPGLSLSRKIFVPDTGLAFARFMNVIENTSPDPITVTLDIAGGRNDNGSLGSDSSTLVSASSSGDQAMSNEDDWASTWDSYDSDPELAHVWQTRGSAVDAADFVGYENGEADELVWQYNDVTIQPGKTVIYMTAEAMRGTVDESIEAAKAIYAEPDELYAGTSDAERALIANWTVQDSDRDGVKNAVDNCREAANADQADIDHDGQGDACDNDIDGDGLSNSTESEIGTDPRNADSDGDGVNDKTDGCPKKAGAGEDGCPVAQVAQTPPGDTTPPNTQIVKVAGAKNVGDLLNGITVTITCDEQCETKTRMLGRMPTGQAFLSATNGGFNKTLGRTYSGFASGTRLVKVRPCEPKPGAKQSKSCLKRLKKAASHKRSVLVKVYVLAEDRAGNTKETSKLIRVRRA